MNKVTHSNAWYIMICDKCGSMDLRPMSFGGPECRTAEDEEVQIVHNMDHLYGILKERGWASIPYNNGVNCGIVCPWCVHEIKESTNRFSDE